MSAPVDAKVVDVADLFHKVCDVAREAQAQTDTPQLEEITDMLAELGYKLAELAQKIEEEKPNVP